MNPLWSTVIICVVLAAVCIFAVRSYVKKLKHGCCGSGGDAVRRIRPRDRDAGHYPYACRIHIDGMSCKNCALRVENAFHEREGYLAEVQLQQNCALIRMKQPVPEEELKEIIRRAGYCALRVEQASV